MQLSALSSGLSVGWPDGQTRPSAWRVWGSRLPGLLWMFTMPTTSTVRADNKITPSIQFIFSSLRGLIALLLRDKGKAAWWYIYIYIYVIRHAYLCFFLFYVVIYTRRHRARWLGWGLLSGLLPRDKEREGERQRGRGVMVRQRRDSEMACSRIFFLMTWQKTKALWNGWQLADTREAPWSVERGGKKEEKLGLDGRCYE